MVRRPLILLLPPLLALLTGIAHAQNAAAPAPVPIVSSPISGIVFEDAPRILPVDSRFSQAIETIGFDLGLSCSQIESYGWTLAPTEQSRVNGIFTNAAEELARLGYAVQPQNPASATADLTVYTATRPDRTVLFTWSAGANGLLLLLCDTRTDVVPQGFGPAPGTVRHMTNLAVPGQPVPPPPLDPQTLIGTWQGTYSCMAQGPTGATLTISRTTPDLSGVAISGSFSFYPLDDATPAPRGSYRVAGRLDAQSGRAILDPGVWLDRPPGFSSAPLIAEFTPAQKDEGARVSAVFQATTGCTSFEGTYQPGSALAAMARATPDAPTASETARKAKPAPRKAKKPTAKPAKSVPAETAPTPAADTPASAPVTVPDEAPADVPAAEPAPATSPATPEPAAEAVATDKTDGQKPLTVEPLPADAKPATPAPTTVAPITVPATAPAPAQ